MGIAGSGLVTLKVINRYRLDEFRPGGDYCEASVVIETPVKHCFREAAMILVDRNRCVPKPEQTPVLDDIVTGFVYAVAGGSRSPSGGCRIAASSTSVAGRRREVSR